MSEPNPIFDEIMRRYEPIASADRKREEREARTWETTEMVLRTPPPSFVVWLAQHLPGRLRFPVVWYWGWWALTNQVPFLIRWPLRLLAFLYLPFPWFYVLVVGWP